MIAESEVVPLVAGVSAAWAAGVGVAAGPVGAEEAGTWAVPVVADVVAVGAGSPLVAAFSGLAAGGAPFALAGLGGVGEATGCAAACPVLPTSQAETISAVKVVSFMFDILQNSCS